MRSDYIYGQLGLIVLVFFVVNSYLSCQEVKYTFWGKTTEATIVSVTKGTEQRGYGRYDRESVPIKGVRFAFNETDGSEREGVVNMPIDWEPPENQKLQIDYMPGDHWKTRIHGDTHYVRMTLFFGSGIGVVIWLCYLYWKGSQER